jgi:cysteinyl-tRNA synthetase
MPLRLYNTLSNTLEEFISINKDEVKIYTCGPTVYHYVHIGNFRTFIFQDILRRYLNYKGYRITHVMNITDVEDKIIASARKQGLSIADYTRKYEEAFFEDMDALRIQRPEIMPRATEHIEEMVELVSRLRDKGLTYEREGSTYFRINNFDKYGHLSGVQVDEESSFGQVDEDEYSKENPRDFVLWKGHKDEEDFWASPFGEGRPGWHLECSAMSMKYLGETFDIHCGGVDLVFPHHENEIAQSEGATGKPFVRYWIHGAHLIVEGQKMSKSLGNFYTLRDLLDMGHNPLALRFLLTSVHYRKQLNFTFDGVSQAQSAIQRGNDFLLRLGEITDEGPVSAEVEKMVTKAVAGFEAAMDDDLNTSAALAAVFELVREINTLLDNGKLNSGDRNTVLGFFEKVNMVFDVFNLEKEKLEDQDILDLIEERISARKNKDFKRADEIRDMLEQKGIILEDSKEGTRWKRRV